jgi:hypothetical protein
MVYAANRLRAEASLPPLVGDSLIARAAENHSRYWTLNPLSATGKLENGPHGELPGTPGFTGEIMSARCAAVGAWCDAEVMHSGRLGPAGAAFDWAATAYHRPLLMSPASRYVGGGAVAGGPEVMDGLMQQSNLQIAPVGYPRGVYSGNRSFSGERPDPGTICADIGQRITAPGERPSRSSPRCSRSHASIA